MHYQLYNMKVLDTETKKIETVLNWDKTLIAKQNNVKSVSYLVTQTKLTKDGINCTQYFEESFFNKRFKVQENG